jgi:signal transduction histidine kinase
MRWETARRRAPGWALDAVIVFLAIAPLRAQLAVHADQGRALLAAALFLVLLGRRRFPASAIIVASVGRLVLTALPPYSPSPLAVFAQILALFLVAGTIRKEWAAWAGWGCGIAIIGATEIIGASGRMGQPASDYGWGDFALTAGVCSVPFAAALLVTRRTRARNEMAERAARAEVARDRSAAEAAAAERTRITREMHDVVAHSLTVAVVQCVAAADDLGSQPADLAAIGKRVRAAEGACRDALDELRRMLGVLRFGAEPLAPTPSLTALPDLTRAISATGVNVELCLEGDLHGLPPGVELSCYRIVQEALTNTLKHSGAKHAHVVVTGLDNDVRVRVDDDGGGATANGHSPGQGLIGMRERAAAYGGTLSAGPDPAGGYLVEAVLPRGERR